MKVEDWGVDRLIAALVARTQVSAVFSVLTHRVKNGEIDDEELSALVEMLMEHYKPREVPRTLKEAMAREMELRFGK